MIKSRSEGLRKLEGEELRGLRGSGDKGARSELFFLCIL
jgi:hypothetical protein